MVLDEKSDFKSHQDSPFEHLGYLYQMSWQSIHRLSRHFTKKQVTVTHGGAGGKVRGSPQCLACLLRRPWMSVPKIHGNPFSSCQLDDSSRLTNIPGATLLTFIKKTKNIVTGRKVGIFRQKGGSDCQGSRILLQKNSGDIQTLETQGRAVPFRRHILSLQWTCRVRLILRVPSNWRCNVPEHAQWRMPGMKQLPWDWNAAAKLAFRSKMK